MSDAGTSTPSIEFLVPFWGDVSFLARTLGSLRSQEDGNFTALVVDDASPHGAEVSTLVAALDGRFRYERNPHNLGITANFQRCLERSRGDFIVFLGCDDLVLPSYTSTVRAALTAHPDTTILQPGVLVIDGHERPVLPAGDRVKALLRRRFPAGVSLSGDRVAASLLHANWLYFPSLCFRRAKLIDVGFDPRWRIVEDLAAVLELLFRGATLVLHDEPTFAYRRHSSSVSSIGASAGWRFVEEGNFFRETAEKASELGWRCSARAARWHWASRAHALMMLPQAMQVPGRAKLSSATHLLQHVLLPPGAQGGRSTG